MGYLDKLTAPPAHAEMSRMAGYSKRPMLGRNLTFSLLDNLGRSIVTGHYDDKPFPTEAELAKEHGVSRSVTREAVKMLSAKGLLSARPRQGTIIEPVSSWNLFDADVLSWLLDRRFSIELLREFSQLRVAIEPEAAALAAMQADETALTAISNGLERMKEAEKGHDDPLDADIEFHVAILRASGNMFYAQFRDMVATALLNSIRFTNRIVGRSASIADHSAVLEAIRQRKPERARAAMRNLIDDVLEVIENNTNDDQSGS